MDATEAIEYLAQGVSERGLDVFAGIIAAIGKEAGRPLKGLRLTFYEGPVTSLIWKFSRPDEEPPE